MSIITTIYAVHLDSDDRNMGYPAEFYSTQGDADVAAKGRGWYGGNAPVKPYPAIVVDGLTYLLAQSTPVDLDLEQAKQRERVRQEALAKLSPEEIDALGIRAIKSK